MRKINLKGMKFGRLLVIEENGHVGKKTSWLCECECGTLKNVITNDLTSGNTKSCGCIVVENTSNLNKKHSLYNSRLYRIWCGMKQRCYNKNSHAYNRYGGSNVTVCEEWINNFENFYNWSISNGYKDSLTIDRIDPYGSYEPNNCRWATYKQQAENKRKR